jgi:hypothetical protein
MAQVTMNSISSRNYWVIAIVSALIGALGTLGAVYIQPKPSLSAEVRGYPIYRYYEFDHMKMREAIKDESLFKTMQELDNATGLFEIIIANNGDNVAKGTEIHIDNAIKFATTIGKNIEYRDGKTGIAKIGDIKPREQVKVIAWVRYGGAVYSHRPPSNIKIFHENGTVSIEPYYEVTGLFRFLDKNSTWVTIIVYMLLIGSVPFISIRSYYKKTKKEENLRQNSVSHSEKP